MELIWGEIAIGLKAVAEELGQDLSGEADLQRAVDTFQGAVRDSREEPSHGYWEAGDYS